MMGLILVVPLTTESGTIEVLHWVLQSDGCTNGVLISSSPVDIAVMDSVVLRDIIRVSFEETPRLVLLLGEERNGSSCGWLGHALLIAVALHCPGAMRQQHGGLEKSVMGGKQPRNAPAP